MPVYDDSKFNVITRKWFGLSTKHGGDYAADALTAFEVGSNATCVAKVARWYPRGPIEILKAGVMVVATLQKRVASNWELRHRFFADGASASVGITVTHDPGTATQVAPFVISSSVTITRKRVKAGAYIRVKTATPQTDSNTRLTSSVLGTLAYFIDYRPLFDPKWSV